MWLLPLPVIQTLGPTRTCGELVCIKAPAYSDFGDQSQLHLRWTLHMAQGLLDTLCRWKVHKFRDSDLPFEIGVDSLDNGAQLIEAKRTGAVEWGVRCTIMRQRSYTDAGAFYRSSLLIPTDRPYSAMLPCLRLPTTISRVT